MYGDGSALALDPDSLRLSAIRNHLEHKYLKVHDSMWSGPRDGTGFNDSLAYSISKPDLEKLTMKLLRLVRSALIYLVLGVHSQEHHRKVASGHVAPLYFPLFNDNWKN